MNNITDTVRHDYAALAQNTAPEELAKHRQTVCGVERYNSGFMKNVPKSVVDADFGCGNPTKYVRAGDVVLDIGCGAGMNCYIAAQAAGPDGRVIGIDFTETMLDIARGAQAEFVERVKAAPLTFAQASANDLRLDLEWAGRLLAEKPIDSPEALRAYNRAVDEARATSPVVADASVDVVISNCVINLLDDADKPAVFREIARVLKPGGRFAISDNVSNIPVPESVKADTVLWSACYAGVLQEQDFYAQLEAAGLVNLRIEVRNPDPAHKVGDLIFYSVTVTGEKASVPAAAATSVMYRGPLKAVLGESGKIYRRGVTETLAPKDIHIAADLEAYGFLAVSDTVSAPPACCG